MDLCTDYLSSYWRRKEYANKSVITSTTHDRKETYPKNAIAKDHSTAFDQFTIRGGDPSASRSSRERAGRIPTKPAAKGI